MSRSPNVTRKRENSLAKACPQSLPSAPAAAPFFVGPGETSSLFHLVPHSLPPDGHQKCFILLCILNNWHKASDTKNQPALARSNAPMENNTQILTMVYFMPKVHCKCSSVSKAAAFHIMVGCTRQLLLCKHMFPSSTGRG